jgi:hypothetical protein
MQSAHNSTKYFAGRINNKKDKNTMEKENIDKKGEVIDSSTG